MTAVVFPTYFLARTIVGKPGAVRRRRRRRRARARLLAGDLRGGARLPVRGALLLSRSRRRSRRARAGGSRGAVVASLVAPLVRAELGVIAVDVRRWRRSLYFLTSEAGQRWRASWTAWDWVGAVVLTTGAIVFFSAVVGNFSQSW